MSTAEQTDAVSDSTETLNTHKAAMKRCEWKLKVAVMQAVTESGGMVFGGAVRDYWIHDQNAAAFYENVGEIAKGIAGGAGAGAAAAGVEGVAAAAAPEDSVMRSVVCSLYNDAGFMPKHRGRCVMPYDIDAYIHETRLKDLLFALRLARFGVTLISDTDPHDYIPHTTLLPGQVRHQRYRIYGFPTSAAGRIRQAINDQIPLGFRAVFEGVINEFYRNLKETLPVFPSVAVDLMVSHVPLPAGTIFASGLLSAAAGQPMPPFANLDFECNGLVLTRDGIALSEHLKSHIVGARDNPMRQQREIQRILKETLEWKARLAQPEPAAHRVRKMVRKGYRIVGFKYVREAAGAAAAPPAAADGANRCLICHGDLVGAHYKLDCCDARYHARCLERAGSLGANSIKESETCPMCRQYREGLRGDMGVLSAILSVIPVVTDSDSGSDANFGAPPAAPVAPVAPRAARVAAAIVQSSAAAAAARVSALSHLAPLRTRVHSEVVIRYRPRTADEARAALRSLQTLGSPAAGAGSAGAGSAGGSSGSGEAIVANGNLVAEVSQSRMSDVD